ncbi:hypothetical protein J2W46_005829 [Paraburkholderia strydomiana]|nr:hypothetical protein [Paraburkholderia strydomiana]
MHLWLRIGHPTLRLKRNGVHLTPASTSCDFPEAASADRCVEFAKRSLLRDSPSMGARKTRRREVIGSCMPLFRNSIRR